VQDDSFERQSWYFNLTKSFTDDWNVWFREGSAMIKPVKFNGLVNVRVPDQMAGIRGRQ